MMDKEQLYERWKKEESIAHIKGWDFSYIEGRHEEVNNLTWDYRQVIRQYLKEDMRILDYDTGGGEMLLSIGHPYRNTAATEGYPPNVELCKKTLLPLGIDFKECNDPQNIPFPDESFDIIINRHGDFDPKELYRLLKRDGLFITQQVGDNNDTELVKLVLPEVGPQFSGLNLADQKKKFEEAGFTVIQGDEAFCPIRFFDTGAFVWFARIIEWEFPEFSVDKCFEKLLEVENEIRKNGKVEGTAHRYLIVAKK